VVIPFVAVIAAVPMLWNELIGWTDVALFCAMYFVSTMGITVGYHRLLTHRAFATYKRIEYGHGGPLRGLWHAHLGWLFDHVTADGAEKHAPDLVEDRGMRVMHKLFGLLVIAGLAIPFLAGWGLQGEIAGGLTALFWAGLVRIFLVHHVTFSINSVCHFFGRRRFSTDDQSTNVFWLALPSFGEAWHHNHHAFPRSALHGLKWWEVDPGGWVIRAMKRLGLAWNVVLITKERQQEKLASVRPLARS